MADLPVELPPVQVEMEEVDSECTDKDMQLGENAPFGLGAFTDFLKNRDPVKISEGFKILYNNILGNISGLEDDKLITGRYVCYEWPKIITPRYFSKDIIVIEDPEDETKYKTKLAKKWSFSFAKFIYCLFIKFLIFPVPQLMMIVIRYTVMFLLMIIEPLKALIFSILNSIPYIGSALMAKGITNVKYRPQL